MPLAWLSPTIVERIFRGDIPHDLTLGRLKQHVPLSWKEQDTLFSLHIPTQRDRSFRTNVTAHSD
jgi:hypothetical protein